MAVQIDSLALQDNITSDSFTISQNPVIKKWDKDTLMIKNNANSFEIPGQNLISGIYPTSKILPPNKCPCGRIDEEDWGKIDVVMLKP